MDVIGTGYLPHVIAAVSVLASAAASAHAVMYKRESRAAAAWVALVWLSPFIGPVLYLLVGVNRIRRRAMARRVRAGLVVQTVGTDCAQDEGALEKAIDQVAEHHREGGHRVEVLENGDSAYPAMCDAIRGAKHTVHLCTYIFDSDRAGQDFCAVLRDGVAWGVAVRVIVDDIGARYSFPSVVRTLKKAGVQTARFGRSRWPWHMRYANLRNHRKILVVDGAVAFAGGMNIRQGNVLAWQTRHATRDLHFRFEGAVVHQLDTIFCDDWELVTRQKLVCTAPDTSIRGAVHARCLADGPDSPVDSIRWAVLAALGCAKRRGRIVTPYFVPDAGLITALCTASLRGVHVEIVLPEANNLRLVNGRRRRFYGKYWSAIVAYS